MSSPALVRTRRAKAPVAASPPKSEKARVRLLSAALSMFADRGFDGVSTGEIALASGVSQSVVLYHFGNKEALWREAMQLLFARIAADGPPSIDLLTDLDEISRLKVTLRAMVQVAARFPELGRVVLREGTSGGPRLNWLHETLLGPRYKMLTRFFVEAAAARQAEAMRSGHADDHGPVSGVDAIQPRAADRVALGSLAV